MRARSKSELLTHVIETLQQSPGIHRVEAQLLAHEARRFRGRFWKQGFQRHPRLFMVLPLRESAREKARCIPTLRFGRWAEQTTRLRPR